MVLYFISLMDNDDEYLFMCFFGLLSYLTYNIFGEVS